MVRLMRSPADHRAGSREEDHGDLLVSYTPDADIPLVRYALRRRKHPETGDGFRKNVTSPHRNRLVATIIDQCQTRGNREAYVDELKEHVAVHVYGRCGAPCPGKSQEDCLRYTLFKSRG